MTCSALSSSMNVEIPVSTPTNPFGAPLDSISDAHLEYRNEKEKDKMRKKERKEKKSRKQDDEDPSQRDTDKERDKDKKRVKKKKKERKEKRSLHGSIVRPVRSDPDKITGGIASRIGLPPLQASNLPSSSPTSPNGFAIQKPPQLPMEENDSDEELEDIYKQSGEEPRKNSPPNEPLRCPAPTPTKMWTGEVRPRHHLPKTKTERSLRLAMEELRMTSVLTRSMSMPTMLRKPIAISARKSIHSTQVPRLNLSHVYNVESCSARLERIHFGPDADRCVFEITPRSAFTLTPRMPQTPHTAH